MSITADAIKHKAVSLGFDVARVTDALPVEQTRAEQFDRWLSLGYAGPMTYMHRYRDKRLDPALLHGPTQSIVIVGLNYKPATDLPDTLPAQQGRVAHYAWYPDYHGFVKARLHELLAWIGQQVPLPARAKVCVDSAPVAERALALRSGLGFLGKNHMVIHPDLGPELLLGELFLPVTLESDGPIQKDCGSCTRCGDACPTGALRRDGFFDASRCINTLTIEQAGDIPESLAALIGDRLFGCDQCVKVCPYAKKAPANTQQHFKEIEGHRTLSLETVMAMDQAAFDKEFQDTPLHCTGLSTLQRSAQQVIRNQAPSP